MAVTTEDAVPLSGAPERFCDRDTWHAYIACFPTTEAALRELGQVSRDYFRQVTSDLARLHPDVPERRRDLRAFQLGDALSDELRHALRSGRLVATGYVKPATVATAIGPEVWDSLTRLDFEKNSASGGGREIEHIKITHADQAAASSERIKRCIDKLLKRKAANGPEPKKQAWAAVQDDFKPSLTTREFSAAFKAAYGTKRGRQRHTPIMNK